MYKITTDDRSQPQIEAVPAKALAPFAEVCTTLELAPWNGVAYHAHQPDSPMRAFTFGPHGEGDVVYLILEDQRRVDILVVLWLAQT